MTTIVAFDGEQAARLATGAAKPHVVVMDIEMPVMDGFQAAIAIKLALGELCPLLIAVSGNFDRVEFAAGGGLFDHTFGKPLQVGMLAALLDSVSYAHERHGPT
jgi:CheY-like chemotaxis protein